MMENRTFGYARVSSKDQNEARQVSALLDFGVNERELYIDKQSGKDFNRDQYQLMLRNIRKGDLVVFLSLDRMGRNYTEIREQWNYLTNTLGADIKILDMELLDTRANDNSLDRKFICDLVLQILSYVAEKERINIRHRQEQGIKEALNRGVHFGRKAIVLPENFDSVVEQYKNGEISPKNAIALLGMTRSSFYKQLNLRK